ncbi:PfkB family carbohydrate kinase [Lacrimispora sp. BS-2]|uniref:PfkB family carbohydrate kinase n=1 Tax=Lacrimispora sp. BS-2 TaxID=3151850 RepID=A0AAU7PUY3_9FIRM
MGWEDGLSLEKYSEYLKLADYFTPNQKEALEITKTKNLQDAADKLKEYFDQVIIKLDKNGCMLVEGDTTHIIPPLENIKAVDATGAEVHF